MNNIYKTLLAYKNKITNKLWGVVYMPAKGKKKGSVLISYLTEPFTFAPWEKFSNFHSNYWECYEIAKLFSAKGYECDIVNASNKKFIPKKKYNVCVGTDDSLEKLAKYLPKNCKKVFHILISHWKTYNYAEVQRINDLEKRRGVKLFPRRQVEPSNSAEIADFLEGFGNKNIFKSFQHIKKPIFFIPASNVIEFDFPKDKDFNKARKHFLWIGGGGAVLKGLDLTLEAFASMPDLHLHVCGPIYAEKDFFNEYKKELENTPNIHTYGRIDVTEKKFSKIINKCSSVIYPTAGEGSSTSIILAMNAGLIPIITHETGIQEDSNYIPLENLTPESIAKTIKNFSEMPIEKIKEKSHTIWDYARNKYTQKEFSKAYKKFINEVLKL